MILMPLVLATAAAMADPSAGAREPLSLEAALARASAQNPDLRALRERATASATRGEGIRKQKLPRLGAEVNAQRTDNAAAVFAHKLNAGQFTPEDFEIARLNSPSAISHLGSSLFVEVPIDLFGRVNLASDAQAAGQKAITENVREAEASIALQVTEAYLGAVLARKAALTTEKAVAAVRSREAITEARFAEGVALQSDVLRVRARRRAREADLASQLAELEVAEAMLARLIAAPDGIRVDLTHTAKPGETNRYRVRYYMLNPLYKTGNVAKNPGTALQVWIVNDDNNSPWSSAISTPPLTHVFLAATPAANFTSAKFVIFHWQNGQ